jgi:hypothetical protein
MPESDKNTLSNDKIYKKSILKSIEEVVFKTIIKVNG